MAANDDILHQADVEKVMRAIVEAGVGKNQAAIADLAAPSAAYSQVEAANAQVKINQILAVLRAVGIVNAT